MSEPTPTTNADANDLPSEDFGSAAEAAALGARIAQAIAGVNAAIEKVPEADRMYALEHAMRLDALERAQRILGRLALPAAIAQIEAMANGASEDVAFDLRSVLGK